jgi:hypothetical protein
MSGERIIWIVAISLIVGLIGYSSIGSEGKVDMIKELAPQEITDRGWEIMRYEGYQRGSWGNHGGKVWYHVKDSENPNIQYRVYVTEWGGELHFCYGQPEVLERIEIKHTQ